ncbi:MAG: glycoside hydrolase 5 family protein [Planctomycetota bacterium]|jgi:hypothetical protein
MKLIRQCLLLLLVLSLPSVAAEGVVLLRAPASVKRLVRWELDFLVPGTVPFVLAPEPVAVIQSPSGANLQVPAYWTQDYALHYDTVERVDSVSGKPVHRDKETALPVEGSDPHWRVRFTPTVPGLHRVQLLSAPNGRVLWEGRFGAEDVPGRGFLRLGKPGERTLRFDNGEGYFALGFNVCWPPSEEGVRGYVKYLDRLAANGCNYTRLWLCTWGFRLETTDPARLNLGAAWQVEQVFREAEKRGIQIKLCIDNFYDFTNHYALGPYLSEKGVSERPRDFFTSPKAQAVYEARLRYLVARFSAFPNLYAWELWNEVDLALPDRLKTSKWNRDRYLVPWTQRTAATLRALDPHRHLITTSLSSHVLWPELWALKELDLVQHHAYLHYLPLSREEEENDVFRLFQARRRMLEGWKKPFLMAEFGYVGTNEYNPLNEMDRSGIALHNSLWVAALTGYSGTPMHWWWDYYLEKHDLYSHYRALSMFLQDIDWRLPKTYLVSEEDPQARVVVMMDAKGASAWFQNQSATWQSRVETGNSIRPVEGLQLTVDGLTPGTYQIRWVDPYSGETMREEGATVRKKELLLAVPSFEYDIAVRVCLQKKSE